MENINFNSSLENNLYVIYLKTISRNLSIYIYLFYLIIGDFGTIFKILFFLQKPIRTCPCSVYMIAATITDFITLNNIPILIILSNFYPRKTWIHMTTIRPILTNRSNKDLVLFSLKTIQLCKIQNYFHTWSTDVSIQLLLLASINRYFSSSKKLKQRTNQRLNDLFCKSSNAIKISLGSCIMWAFISLHHYFNFTLVSNFCVPKYFILWAVWVFDIHCLIPSACMMVFSTLTLINIRKGPNSSRRQCGNDCREASSRLQTFLNNPSNRHHIEQQLTSMIITEIIATILTTLPYGIYVIYQAMRSEHERSLEFLAREDLIEQSIRLTIYLEPSCGFYVYLFTLTTLRKRFLRILWNKIRCC